MIMAGSHTHKSSERRTCRPRPAMKRSSESGDTMMGRQEKKNRSLEKGASNATPNPPLVRASRSAWETVAMNTNKKAAIRPEPRRRAMNMAMRPSSRANAMECENPR